MSVCNTPPEKSIFLISELPNCIMWLIRCDFFFREYSSNFTASISVRNRDARNQCCTFCHQWNSAITIVICLEYRSFQDFKKFRVNNSTKVVDLLYFNFTSSIFLLAYVHCFDVKATTIYFAVLIYKGKKSLGIKESTKTSS